MLYDILKSESDEERPLSTNELIEKLAEYGITATRQTIYDDIEMLNAFGYEILCNHGRYNRYFVGDRTFELPEVQILLLAIGASKSLSGKKSAVLSGKITELLGNVQAEKVKELLTENECEYGNETIYYSIDTITTALLEKRKLSFLYFDYGAKGEKIYRKNKERYEVNPLGMVYSGECFYISFFENAPTRIRQRSKRLQFSHGKINQECIRRFKVHVEQNLTDISAELRVARKEATNLSKEVLFSKDSVIRYNNAFQEQILDLVEKLPPSGRISYDSENMLPLKPLINTIVDMAIKTAKSWNTFRARN